MQKSVKIISLFVLLILGVFVSMNFISALPNYSCNVTTVANCNAGVGGNIVMGVSAPTNAHGEFPYVSYPYVLCCYFGGGDTSCSPLGNPSHSIYGSSVPKNKIVGLTSSTNAHAEAPGQTVYPTSVCYWADNIHPIECVSTTSGCDSNYYLLTVNLSNYTNAHIGTGVGFNTAICCKLSGLLYGQLNCKLTSATWTYSSAMQGVQVGLNVTGTNCAGATLTFNVTDSNGNRASNYPGDVTFPLNAPTTSSVASTWTAEYHSGRPNSYKFVAISTLSNNFSQSGPPNATLSTTVQPASFCTGINTCNDYTPYGAANCTSDTSLCNIAKNDPNKDPRAYSYGCAWNITSNKCNFVNIYQANGAISCANGYTLCTNQTSGLSYCSPTVCDSTETPISNGNGVCDLGEGCSSIDCHNGDADNCAAGSKCQAGICYTASVNPVNITQCANGYTLCYNTAKKLTYCNPSDVCPTGTTVTNNSCANLTIADGANGVPSSCLGDGVCKKTPKGGYCSSPTASVGRCVYTFSGSAGNTCTNGFITYSWTATWTGNSNKPANCVSGQSVIECPAQIPLPLFTPLNLIITIASVIAIYVVIVLVRKSKKHTIHRRRRK